MTALDLGFWCVVGLLLVVFASLLGMFIHEGMRDTNEDQPDWRQYDTSDRL